ncbi:nicotinamidase-related amidase [Curtobacterium sp. PhB130]|uniref:isochorismatase family protein n=1 Tax=unclassified Curtobacterium TaxID=257496 RepID=UPI000F4BBBAD|nr:MULTISPECIES: isochorismatase family protein [unclassified Curtobacterium]ROS77724.1 nicotinamidase-related amidase [Curtobacterium sp. PhB130]TCK66067.1 nicotinamidase-related amidase [Curtobacterium sp. PhB136]
MSIELDPTPALVVIDLQTGILGQPTAHPIDGVVSRAAALARAFRARRLPVVLVNVAATAPGRTERTRAMNLSGSQTIPEAGTRLLDELDQQPTDITVTKRTLGAFGSTDLDARLRSLGVTQIVLVGVATSSGVESTGRSAHELGYDVAFVTDAMTDAAEAHEASVSLQLPKIGELGTTDDVLALLDAR